MGVLANMLGVLSDFSALPVTLGGTGTTSPYASFTGVGGGYTCTGPERVVACIATLPAARTVYLAPAASVPAGTRVLVLDTAGALSTTLYINIKPASTSSDTLNGMNTSTANLFRMSTPYAAVELESDGTSKWTVIDQNVLNYAIYSFTTNGNVAVPAWATRMRVLIIQAGNGGGSGGVSATAALVYGGGGGCSGVTVQEDVKLADLGNPATIYAVVGAAGAGGAAKSSTTAANGNGGGSAAASYVCTDGTVATSFLAACTGATGGGAGGGASIPAASSVGLPNAANPGATAIAAGSGITAYPVALDAAGGGGGGGGISAANANLVGGAGAIGYQRGALGYNSVPNNSSVSATAGGVAGAATGTGAGGAGGAQKLPRTTGGGGGGGGGNSTSGGTGGNGGFPGGGGGGGGASRITTGTSGAGGNGGGGLIVIEFFPI